MKKLFLSFLFVAFAFTSMEVNAGTITIDTTQVTYRNKCDLNSPVVLRVEGDAVGYVAFNDTIRVEYSFGDGQVFTGRGFVDTNDRFMASITHTYANSGQYTVRYVVIAPDSVADTLVVPNEVVLPDSCGNVKGRVYIDSNSDCIFDNSDSALYAIRVDAVNNGQIEKSTWTDTAGLYSLEVPTGPVYTIEINDLHGFTTICPSGGSYTVSSLPSDSNDFALSCGSNFDVFGDFIGRATPGRTLVSRLRAFNSLCSPKSGTVKLVVEDSLFHYNSTISTMHSAINGDTIEFDFNNISFNNYNHYTSYFYTDTTAQIGDTICVTVITTPIAGDSIPGNNIEEFCFPVRTSYDPNIKEVTPIGESNLGKIAPETEMTYTIHFQNTGTAQAYNIYILDTLDTNVLDPETINILGASHEVKTSLISSNQNVLRFRFDDINLPDSNSNEPASKGWVTYTIEQQSGLVQGDKIENAASIYFDYNPPIHTNTTLNTIDNRVVGITAIASKENQFVKCYPNPASDRLNVRIDKNESTAVELKVYSINGQLLRAIKNNKNIQQINVSNFERGIYFLEIKTEDGIRQMNKFVVGQ